MKRHVPNMVTIVGIILAAWANMLVWDGYEGYGLILVLAAAVALTDLLDGIIARRNQAITAVGISLDKFRDKLFICPLMVFFLKDMWARPGLIAGLNKAMVALILLVELGLVVIWIYGFFKGLDVSSHRYGKIKMDIYFAVACLFLAARFLEKSSPAIRIGSAAGEDLLLAALLVPAAVYAIKSLTGYLERYSSVPARYR